MTNTQFVPLILWTVGGLLCVFTGHPEYAGLGLMIVAGCARIAWGAEDIANAR